MKITWNDEEPNTPSAQDMVKGDVATIISDGPAKGITVLRTTHGLEQIGGIYSWSAAPKAFKVRIAKNIECT